MELFAHTDTYKVKKNKVLQSTGLHDLSTN